MIVLVYAFPDGNVKRLSTKAVDCVIRMEHYYFTFLYFYSIQTFCIKLLLFMLCNPYFAPFFTQYHPFDIFLAIEVFSMISTKLLIRAHPVSMPDTPPFRFLSPFRTGCANGRKAFSRNLL